MPPPAPPPGPRICILPKFDDDGGDGDERTAFKIISLPHPRTNAPTRYLLHPTRGLHELTKISSASPGPPAAQPRSSWLLTAPQDRHDGQHDQHDQHDCQEARRGEEEGGWVGCGQAIEDGAAYVATPMDPLFLLLPHLLPPPPGPEGARKKRWQRMPFAPMDDLLDSFTDDEADDAADGCDAATTAANFAELLRPGTAARAHVEARIRAVSKAVDTGGGESNCDQAYGVALVLVDADLARKCHAVAAGGLPRGLEDAFVASALVRPVVTRAAAAVTAYGSVAAVTATASGTVATVTATTASATAATATAATATAATTIVTSTTATTTTTATATATAKAIATTNEQTEDTKVVREDAADQPPPPQDIVDLLRLRVASQFLAANYLQDHIATSLFAHLAGRHDFRQLDAYLDELKALRAVAAATRSGDFSLKLTSSSFSGSGRHRDEDEDAAAAQAEEEKARVKKQKQTSRGVRELGKINTRGMAKMTSFFKKKGP